MFNNLFFFSFFGVELLIHTQKFSYFDKSGKLSNFTIKIDFFSYSCVQLFFWLRLFWLRLLIKAEKMVQREFILGHIKIQNLFKLRMLRSTRFVRPLAQRCLSSDPRWSGDFIHVSNVRAFRFKFLKNIFDLPKFPNFQVCFLSLAELTLVRCGSWTYRIG